jgi:uncharacterized protein (TIGR00251 family)
MTDGSVSMRVSDGGVSFRVRVKPGGRRDRLVGAYGGALKVEVSAPPERGKANSAVKKLLAKTLDVPQSAIEILSGETSQDKSIRIESLTAKEFSRRIETLGITAKHG